MKRILYFGYYIKTTDWKKFSRFLEYLSKQAGTSKVVILLDIIYSTFKYNISFTDYFLFNFYHISQEERKTWAGTGFMYEYQLKMNPRKCRNILDDKTKFYKSYRKLIKHSMYNKEELELEEKRLDLLKNKGGKIVFKVSDGKCGVNILFKKINEVEEDDLLRIINENGYDLVEEYIIQHKLFNRLSPSAVNTIRIFTQLNSKNEVKILGCRLRISVNSNVDNLAAGNLAAPVDDATGVVIGPGVYSDITKNDEEIHPVTKEKIIGFKIPFWKETIDLVTEAAILHPENRSIGWDIAMTENGPDIIEGNHDWCKLLWQLPVKRGLKNMLEKHLNEIEN